MANPLTIVLVHGAWHSPEHLVPLRDELSKHGYKCLTPALPTTQSPDEPPKTMSDDTKTIRDAVVEELRSSSVVVVAHSYGGTPANNALKDLDQTSRTAAGKETFVQSLVFMCSAPGPAGVAFIDLLGGKPNAIHDLRTPDFAWVGPPGPEYWFYNELDPAEAKIWGSMLKPFSMGACYEKTTHASYKHIPSYYLVTTKDNTFPEVAQKGLVEEATAGGALFLATEDIECDHSPFLGKHIQQAGEFIRRAAGEPI